MPKNYLAPLRRVAEATSARLCYDYLCFKGSMFNEAYIAYSVGDALLSFYDPNIVSLKAGYVHPHLTLAKAVSSKSGRKTEIDYVVENFSSKKIKVAVETKWAGSSHCSASNVLWDLVRLKLVKQKYPDALCGLVIAGHPNDFSRLFKHKLFKAGTQHPMHRDKTYRKNFKTKNNKNHQKYLNTVASTWLKRYPHLIIPETISTQLEEPKTSANESNRFVCYAWRIS